MIKGDILLFYKSRMSPFGFDPGTRPGSSGELRIIRGRMSGPPLLLNLNGSPLVVVDAIRF